MTHASPRLITLTLISLLCCLTAQAKTLYRVQEVVAPEGSEAIGYSINDAGQIAGSTTTRAFLSDTDGKMILLPKLATLPADSPNYTFGYGINTSGQVTGNVVVPIDNIGNSVSHLFIYDGNLTGTGNLTDLGSLPNSADNLGLAINDSGQITGYASFIDENYSKRAFITDSNGNMTDLGIPSTYSLGVAINNQGQVTGRHGDGFEDQRKGFVTGPNGQGLQTLGTLGGTSSAGTAINASGQVAGYSSAVDNKPHAFVTDSTTGAMHDLGTLGGSSSQAWGINDAGVVTGSYEHKKDGRVPFVTDADGKMADLNSLLVAEDVGKWWLFDDARDINNQGQIVASGKLRADLKLRRAVILHPVNVQDNDSPLDLAHGDRLKLSESQKDTIKCGPLQTDPVSQQKSKTCSQLTTGNFTLSLKLSAETLENNLIDLSKINAYSPFSLNIGSYVFSGTLSNAEVVKKTKSAPTSLPATWIFYRTLHNGGKHVTDASVKISADKKSNLTIKISGKRWLVNNLIGGQQVYASLCQASSVGNSTLTQQAKVDINNRSIAFSTTIKCKRTQTSKSINQSSDGPFDLNNLSISAKLSPS